MTRLHERIETTLPIEAAFDYVADFANAQEWDPGVASARRIDAGPVAVGARYDLGVRMGSRVAPMEYRITELDRPRRVVLVGAGSNVDAVDDIRFERSGDGTVIDYTADIRLGGLLRFVQPFLGGSFANLARNAAGGMERTLAVRATDAARTDEGIA
ncbi:MAG TPA: SRPBCC family protein [Candidatus Limnocylindrales bacterium]